MIPIARMQTTNDVPEPGGTNATTRYLKASKERSIVLVGPLVFVTDTDRRQQIIIPAGACDFLVPATPIDPKTGKPIPIPDPPPEAA